jgi:hypothetical protein
MSENKGGTEEFGSWIIVTRRRRFQGLTSPQSPPPQVAQPTLKTLPPNHV